MARSQEVLEPAIETGVPVLKACELWGRHVVVGRLNLSHKYTVIVDIILIKHRELSTDGLDLDDGMEKKSITESGE